MKHFSHVLIFLIFFGQILTALAAEPELSHQDQSKLLVTIEDYRFSDFDTAIPALYTLHLRYPTHLETTRYLALSYQENMQHEKAIQTFKTWLDLSTNRILNKTKFAWVGIANSHLQLKQYDKAEHTIQSWLTFHPNDTQALIILVDIQVRAKTYDQANQTCTRILNVTDASRSAKAGAWYYKAWIAYLDGDMSNMKNHANQSLTLDAEGAYAQPAKQLIASSPLKRKGFVSSAALEIFYNSNVELLPDILQSSDGGSDSGSEINIMLGWGFEHTDITYVFNQISHQTRSDFDLSLHLLSASWTKDAWRLVPSYEVVSLDSNNLYQGTGLAAYFTDKTWTYHYAGKIKSFNDAFGANATDLSRLGGVSHGIGLTKSMKISGVNTVFSSDISSEQTKGDVTHNKTDDYLQIGAGLQTSSPIAKDWILNTVLNIYHRQYSAADTSVLIDQAANTKRADTFAIISAETDWRPLENKDAAFGFKASYQDNKSNYDTDIVGKTAIKSYSAWKVAGSFSMQW
ncbi:MAG: hypothetical protein R8M46_08705 [Ghiorsea sp.]